MHLKKCSRAANHLREAGVGESQGETLTAPLETHRGRVPVECVRVSGSAIKIKTDTRLYLSVSPREVTCAGYIRNVAQLVERMKQIAILLIHCSSWFACEE